MEPNTSSRSRLPALVACVATIAGAGLIMLTDFGRDAAMPGPLSSNHAPLRDDCGACHAESATAIQSVAHGLSATRMDLLQSELCVACHAFGDDALFAHGWSADRAALPAGAMVAASDTDQVACATCHHEHQGRDATLATLGDTSCQVCHSEAFESFEHGHPEFESYPYQRRLGIAFDHASHLRDHFPNHTGTAAAPTACTACHALDASGERMPVRNYTTMCAACHDDDIAGSSQIEGAGLGFLGLPALDTMALEERGIAIGRWPSDSMMTEVGVSPFLAQLYASDAERAADVARLHSVDLLDLMDADDDTLAAVERFAWGTKQLLFEVKRDGHAALVARLDADRELADALLNRMPEDLFARALDAWLPDLEDELARHAAGETLPTDSTLAAEASDADIESDRRHERWVETGGWFVRELDFEIRYRPGGHADPFLRAWTDLTASRADARPLFDALTRAGAVGMCSKCHAIEQVDPAEPIAVRWRGASEARSGSELERFSHVAHFASPSDNTCLECHELEPEAAGFVAAYGGRDPAAFTSAFRPIERATCMRCHTEERASSSCLTCHAYHPRRDETRLPSASLDALTRPR